MAEGVGIDRRRAAARRAGLALACLLVPALVACSGGDDAGDRGDEGSGGGAATTGGPSAAARLPEGWAGYESDTYADDAHWLCRAGVDGDVCTGEDLDATSVGPDLSPAPDPFAPAADPPVDCFYVYPTTSQDQGFSADLEVADNQEVWVARNQAARFTGACRVFAPVYRQVTVSAIRAGDRDRAEVDRAWERAYGDVLDAFRHYLANDSDGRGVVLIGHSQGAGILRELVRREVDPEPALRDRVVAAYLIGATVEVPEGEVVGGSFSDMPLCEADDQVSCIVSYATFAANAPPPPDSRFGVAEEAGMRAACVNPGALAGGPATLSPYFPTAIPENALSGASDEVMSRLARLDTGWVTMPDFVEAECAQSGDATYLSVTVGAGEGDQRGSDVGGNLGPDWGLHLVDVNLAMGNLVDLVKAQATAYTG
jgi:hypothetical protein